MKTYSATTVFGQKLIIKEIDKFVIDNSFFDFLKSKFDDRTSDVMKIYKIIVNAGSDNFDLSNKKFNFIRYNPGETISGYLLDLVTLKEL